MFPKDPGNPSSHLFVEVPAIHQQFWFYISYGFIYRFMSIIQIHGTDYVAIRISAILTDLDICIQHRILTHDFFNYSYY